MTDAFMTGSIIVGAANALLAAALLAAYAGTFARTKAPFTLALLVFSGAFLTQNALVVFSYLDMMPLIPNVFTPSSWGSASSKRPDWVRCSGRPRARLD